MFAFASAGKGYDDVTKTADACADRCMAALSSSSFFLKGTQCGCSKTRVGPCPVKASGAYTAYEIMTCSAEKKTLFFSEVAEGSGFNKYLEVGADVEHVTHSKRSAALVLKTPLVQSALFLKIRRYAWYV